MTTESQSLAVMMDGRQYHLRKLTSADEEELSMWVRGRILRTAMCSLPVGVDEAQRQETFSRALFAAAPVNWDDERGREIINQPRGWAQILWHCARAESPLLTTEDIFQGIKRDPAGFQEAVRVFLVLHGTTADGNGQGAEAQPEAA